MIPGSAGSSIPDGTSRRRRRQRSRYGLLVHGVDDAAAVDEGDLIGDLLHVLRVVRREQDAAAFVGHHAGQFAQNLVARDRVEAGGRFVQHQQLGPAGQNQQQGRFDALAVRECL